MAIHVNDLKNLKMYRGANKLFIPLDKDESSGDSRVVAVLVTNKGIVENKQVFLTGGLNGDIRIFRIDNYDYIRTVKYAHDDEIFGLTELKDGTIASYSGDSTIKIWKF